ncbi:YdcF family protein [Hymenobacter tibetensis]|uniref:YdcF family protein n=1 Tax=Hymenobacter tibetensis TaxID=497967 RepID=A0ABY4CWD6_9BACT|nr:YdcF family protein [Hymenobacter tibetensis]UOG73304.1 YdcF family protein [Hymenobacter tibetensis]
MLDDNVKRATAHRFPAGLWRAFFALLACFSGLAFTGFGQSPFPRPAAAYADSALLAQAFPLLSVFEESPALQRALQNDKALQTVARRQAARSYQALSEGTPDAQRYADSVVWKPQEIRLIQQALVHTYANSPEFRALLAPTIGPAGRYPLYLNRPDTAVLRLAWQDAARGLNRILRVYLANQKPRYPAIDSSSFPRHDATLAQKVRTALLPVSKKQRQRPTAYYALPLQAARLALRLNDRDEAIRYEPLSAGLNQAPRAAVRHTTWARYPYSVLLVPGLGPEKPGVALDTLGAFRCRLAAARYRQGLAPFIVVSGGHVHPNKTPYCEAVEMKKYLVQTQGLPDSVVFIEPYARHTTTNLRNTARMLYAFGIPTDRPVLVVTDVSQSRYILGMEERCRRELGYVPYRGLQKVSSEENAFFPVPAARQPDPYDPLDP